MGKGNPLDGIIQQIHDESKTPSRRYLLRSDVKGDDWTLTLWSQIDSGVQVWSSVEDVDEDAKQVEALADALQQGLLHVKVPVSTEDATSVRLKIMPEDGSQHEWVLNRQEIESQDLLQVAFDVELLAEPVILQGKGPVGGDELRSLKALLVQKEEEIRDLKAKLNSMKATVVRATGSDNKKKFTSPVKKAPANASKLQPNAKRRKMVEDEFAGDSSDEDEDNDEE